MSGDLMAYLSTQLRKLHSLRRMVIILLTRPVT